MSTPLHQLAHEVIGDGPNPLVFVHGFTQTRTSWRTVAQAVVSGVPASRAMLIDLPGHGESQQVVADIAESARLITECGGQATYIGYSLGARVVLHALINQPNAVQRAVVISGTAGLVTPAERDERVAADELLAQRIEAIGVEAFVDEWLALPLFADVPLAANQRRERLTNTAQGLATSLRRCGQGTQTPLWNDLAQNTTPLLAIAGSLDAKYVAHARRLATTAPHATLRIIPDAGHATHLVAPQLVADEIIHWITSPTAYSTPTTS